MPRLREKLALAKKENRLPGVLVPVHFAGQPTEQEAIWESRSVRHVRVPAPLDVRIDCATRYGLIRRREES